MKNCIIPIHPKHVEKIFSGEKICEIRKSFPAQLFGNFIIYETAPTSAIVGEFEVDYLAAERNIYRLWEEVKHDAGISKEEYLKYFGRRIGKYCYAIYISNLVKYPEPKRWNRPAPQSYVYTEEF